MPTADKPMWLGNWRKGTVEKVAGRAACAAFSPLLCGLPGCRVAVLKC